MVKGLNIYKQGQDPVTGPDHAYPDWLFTMLQPQPTLRQLEQQYEEDEDCIMSKYLVGACSIG